MARCVVLTVGLRVPLCVRQELMRERYAPELAWVIHHVVLRQYTSWLNIFRRRQAKHRDRGSLGAVSCP